VVKEEWMTTEEATVGDQTIEIHTHRVIEMHTEV
jgi:hypothetical protein